MDNKENPGMGNNQEVRNTEPKRFNTGMAVLIGIAAIFLVVIIMLLLSPKPQEVQVTEETSTYQQYEQEKIETTETESKQDKQETKTETKLEESTSTGTGSGTGYSQQEAVNIILAMSREEKEKLVTYEKSNTSPIGLRVYVDEVLIAATVREFSNQVAFWAACGESKGKHQDKDVKGNGWINGRKASDLEDWRFKKHENGRWYLDLKDALQFNIVQSKSAIPRWQDMNFAAIEIVEEVNPDGSIWRPSWLYNNYTGDEGRVGFDHEMFLIKG
ncbi:MAG: hypothetical protein QY321_02680 [Patescibacteria group bacterium]|nr:MAG: hypothetical protein QY321_02680 [Patescibacteria group bacterium]